MDEQKIFLQVVKVVQITLAGGTIEDDIKQLFELCERQDNAFITRLEQIMEQMPAGKVDDVLHAAKCVSKIAFLRLLNRLQLRSELTMVVIDDYKQQFGEDREILLAELTLLFNEGYLQNQKRIDEIIRLLA